MPEGPEVKRLAQRLGKVLVGKPLSSVAFSYRTLGTFDQELSSSEIELVDSRGKALLIRFCCGKTIYSHNQLYGKWIVTRAGVEPKTGRTKRLVIQTSQHRAALYSASEIEVLENSAVLDHSFLRKLGPDALSEETHWRDVAARLMEPSFKNRSLGALLLDQSFVAGLGNYLRTEILHEACLHPDLRPKDLSRSETGKLARTILEITRLALKTAGVTNKPSRVKRLKRIGLTRSRYRFSAFAREGQACYRCEATIERRSVNSRRLYLCRTCQPDRLQISRDNS